MYESPIIVNHFEIEPMSFEKIQEDKIGKAVNDAAKSIAEQFDRYVLHQVAKTGVTVDRDELIKALRYDRDQYDKGYQDGFKYGMEYYEPTWIPVTERLPEIGEDVLVCAYENMIRVWCLEKCGMHIVWEDESGCWDDFDVVSHWMPLPEPPKDGKDGG